MLPEHGRNGRTGRLEPASATPPECATRRSRPGHGSTVADLDHFFRELIDGRVVDRKSLAQMQRTGPVRVLDGGRNARLRVRPDADRGSGAAACTGGHEGTVRGAGTTSRTSADGRRQMTLAVNLVRWNKPDASGKPQPRAIDGALAALHQPALG
ncbi:hypothetical protein [Streptomyces venezuelae]|uniref:Uncharacterized protein n=1 Tax=Streptomyces venezuelae TaxID=54571 RepID=A0A5P2BHD3_STRVZ|nr:hypothetical protein DEJ47_28065 [Streptomyces venezuelae]